LIAMLRIARRAVAPAALVLLLSCASASAAPAPGAGPIQGRVRLSRNVEYSSNWSGYATLGATFTQVEGSWIEPGANCSGMRNRQLSIASFWVGLDGYESNTVEQTGTDVDCEGAQEYQVPWHELYPAKSYAIGQEVAAGDHMTVRVTRETLRLEDTTRGWHYEESFLPRYDYSSAEWIAEAPTNRLTNFGTVQFTAVSVSDESATSAPIDSSTWSHEVVVMANKGGRPLTERAAPGELADEGRAFSVEWLHS
jgi:peptidase A4-like protein